MKTCDVEKARRTRAIRVVRPPLRTAGPAKVSLIYHYQCLIIPIVATEMPALSAGEPEEAR